jgi:lipopolysaccharide/colanic/teichoic acid biosynthesis glycosyltransferase
MSEEERIDLDIEYARNNSFLFDMKILFSTFPALLQKEKV